MAQVQQKGSNGPGASDSNHFLSGVGDWVREQITEMKMGNEPGSELADGRSLRNHESEHESEIVSTLDQDETEWGAPSDLNYASTIADHTKAAQYANQDLRGSDFSGGHLLMSDFSGATARNVNFEKADLSFADFVNADLCEASLKNCELTKANFQNCNLQNATLVGADLTQANFTGANLCGANLRASIVDSCVFSGAYFDSYTELPFSRDEAIRRGLQNRDTTEVGS